MTLAVAANLECLVSRERRFVLLMSDSRFSGHRWHRDNGAKLWKLCANVGAAFSGDVEIGEKSLALVQRQLAGATLITFQAIRESLEVGVRRFYRKNRPTSFVVGAVSPGGEARLFLVDHAVGPAPQELRDKFVQIGHPDAQAAFWNELEQIPHGLPFNSLDRFGPDPLWEFHLHASPYTFAFARALAGGGETVGLPMQVWIIAEYGEEHREIISLENSDTPGFVRLTTDPGEVRSLHRELRRKQFPLRHRLAIGRARRVRIETAGDGQDLLYNVDNAGGWDPSYTGEGVTPAFRRLGSANIYVRDGSLKLAFLYQDSSGVFYHEMDLGRRAP
jgi:hypothetical protein